VWRLKNEDATRDRSAELLVTNHGTPLTWAKLNLTSSWPRSVPVLTFTICSVIELKLKKGWPLFFVFFIDYQYI
jgi:hypothetical protein